MKFIVKIIIQVGKYLKIIDNLMEFVEFIRFIILENKILTFMKGRLKIIKKMGLEEKYLMMEIAIQVNIKMESITDMEHIIILVENIMKGNLKTQILMDMANIYFKMDISIQDCGRTIKDMVKVYFMIKMEIFNRKANGIKILFKVDITINKI